MRNYLLASTLLVGMMSTANAQTNQLQKVQTVEKQIPARKTEPARKMRSYDNKYPVINNVINPENVSKKAGAREMPDGHVLWENFDEWDGKDASWLPEGWSIDHKDSPVSNRGWKPTAPLSMYDYISSPCMTYEMFEETVDEWLITPKIKVENGMILGWSTMTSPYFYDWNKIDTSKGVQDSYDIINDLTVNVSADGGATWTRLYSHAEELIKETKGNFFSMFNYTVRPFTISLSDYAGKEIMIGFRIEGKDGNTTFIDDVKVGLPPTGTSYSRPLSNLYFGLTEYDEYLPASIMVGPVFSPITFTNKTKSAASKSFTWTWTDSSGEEQTADSQNLSVTYATDHTSAFTSRNNLYDFPVLRGWSDTSAADEFTFPGLLQAGGRGEYERYYTDTDEYEIVDLGLSIADPIYEGTATYADVGLPYFGYNQESDAWWSRQSFDTYANDDNWNHLERIGNFFYSPDSPLVIEGVRTNAYGKITRNTKLTAEIYLLTAGYAIPATPAYTATCTGDDIIIVDRYSSSDFLSFNFKFDKPVVISKTEAPFFFVAITGFRDPENVQYFSPEMSSESNPNNLGLGWTGHQLCMDGTMLPFSWSPVANYTNDELVAFYIMLDGYFPWLEGETEEIDLKQGESVSVTLDSYHDGSNLTVENLSEGTTAKAEGRYGKTVVTFTAANDAKGDSEAKITGHGVTKNIKINLDMSGVDEILTDSDSDGTVRYYNLQGAEVTNPGQGVYIKVEGNKARKVII